VTADQAPRAFEPRPRSESDQRTHTDAQNIRDELERISRRCEIVTQSGRESFTEGVPHYDVASMVVIRLAALLERPEFSALAETLSADEITAIKATRNIAAHASYVGMNDNLFWAAVTTRIPEIVQRLLDWRAP
jgi:hypothetical protein